MSPTYEPNCVEWPLSGWKWLLWLIQSISHLKNIVYTHCVLLVHHFGPEITFRNTKILLEVPVKNRVPTPVGRQLVTQSGRKYFLGLIQSSSDLKNQVFTHYALWVHHFGPKITFRQTIIFWIFQLKIIFSHQLECNRWRFRCGITW